MNDEERAAHALFERLTDADAVYEIVDNDRLTFRARVETPEPLSMTMESYDRRVAHGLLMLFRYVQDIKRRKKATSPDERDARHDRILEQQRKSAIRKRS